MLLLYALISYFPASIMSDAYSLQKMDDAPPRELNPAITKLLGEHAYRVVTARGEVLCEVWFCRAVRVDATAEQVQNGLTYREIPQTTLLGAIKFPHGYKNYRNNEVRAGVYTLRFAMQPQEGDHIGTAPYEEFCLLTEAAKDSDPRPMEVKALMERSAASVEAKHPNVMLLFPNPRTDRQGALTDEGKEHWVLRHVVNVTTNAGQSKLGIGLTVAGQSPLK